MIRMGLWGHFKTKFSAVILVAYYSKRFGCESYVGIGHMFESQGCSSGNKSVFDLGLN